MITAVYARERGIPPMLPQDVIEEIINRPRDDFCSKAYGKSIIIDLLEQEARIFKEELYSDALRKAEKFASEGGFIATYPQLIGFMVERNWLLWGENKFSTYSERIQGEKEGKPLALFIHGGGVLCSKNPQLAEITQITQKALDDLLKGKTPYGESIEIYSLDDVKKGKVKYPFERYGVFLNESETALIQPGVKEYDDERISEFLSNPFVLAAAGTPEYLEDFFRKSVDGVIVAHNHNMIPNDPPLCTGLQIIIMKDGSKLKPILFLNNTTNRKGEFIAVNPYKEAPQ